MEQVEEPTSEMKCDSKVDGIMEGQSSLRTELSAVPILEDAAWLVAQEGESASSDCGGTSDLQEPSSASGEEVEGSETSDITGLEASPGSKGSWGASQQNGDGTPQESPPPNSETPVTTGTISGKIHQ